MFRPFSIVVKVIEADGRPAGKLSNNTGKATGKADLIRQYVDVFGDKGRVDMKVEV